MRCNVPLQLDAYITCHFISIRIGSSESCDSSGVRWPMALPRTPARQAGRDQGEKAFLVPPVSQFMSQAGLSKRKIGLRACVS